MSVRHEVLRRCQAVLAEHEIDDEEEACEHAVRVMLGDPWSNGGPEAGPADRRRLQLEQLELLDTRRELFLLAARSAHGEPDREAHQAALALFGTPRHPGPSALVQPDLTDEQRHLSQRVAEEYVGVWNWLVNVPGGLLDTALDLLAFDPDDEDFGV